MNTKIHQNTQITRTVLLLYDKYISCQKWPEPLWVESKSIQWQLKCTNSLDVPTCIFLYFMAYPVYMPVFPHAQELDPFRVPRHAPLRLHAHAPRNFDRLGWRQQWEGLVVGEWEGLPAGEPKSHGKPYIFIPPKKCRWPQPDFVSFRQIARGPCPANGVCLNCLQVTLEESQRCFV